MKTVEGEIKPLGSPSPTVGNPGVASGLDKSRR